MSQSDTATNKNNQSSINEGLDRKTLNTIKQRFLDINKERLERTKSALGGRQEVFLELLPLLFHVNHPILPGYVSVQTPSGLVNYTPTRKDIQRAQRWARSFTYRYQPAINARITSIFLMGSCGTIAQSGSSDLDIWICTEALSAEENMLLRQKCDEISRWADSIGQEAHFFIMEAEKFRLGEREGLSTEDCGSSQHYLLLDEFYRTGLLIAGRIPIWWLVPPDEENNYDFYADTLREKRFIRSEDTIDFGNVGDIPSGEFIGAGVWQLYKAIDSPYKSVLKILLTEVYAAEYPNVEPLSTSFKRAIYNERLDIVELDPYVMVYRKLEHYLLERKEFKRLELIRRCFYFKVGKLLTRPSRLNKKSWQRQLMERLTKEWQWQTDHLHNLDARKTWKVTKVELEQKALVRELTNSYRFVLEFARRTHATAIINSQEMSILGRKLYAAFERKAGKIEWINPGIAPDLSEETLTFYQPIAQENNTRKWAACADSAHSIQVERAKPIKQGDTLTSLMAWCHFNGIVDSSTRIAIARANSDDNNLIQHVRDSELHNMFRSMRQVLPVAKQYSELGDEQHRNFSRGMRPTQIQLFINVGFDPLSQNHEQGIEIISGHTDSLGYSGLRENLVQNIEQVTVNSWGELSTSSYHGKNALIKCLHDYLNMLPPKNSGLPQLDIHCFCPSRATAISNRVEELFRDIAACYYTGTRPIESRYIMEIQREYFVLQFFDNRPSIEQTGSYSSLLNYLSQVQSIFSPIILDRYCLKDSLLATISELNSPEKIQIFYQKNGKIADIYIFDEMGSLYSFTMPFVNEPILLSPLDQFIQSTLFRQSSETVSDSSDYIPDFDLNSREVEYYSLTQKGNKVEAKRRNIISEIGSNIFFNVQAIGYHDDSGDLQFTIYCDQQEFSANELGDELFHAVAKFILKRRKSNERYPCYITDLDLSRCEEAKLGQIQTIHYLRQKQKLETKLNNILQSI